MLAYAKLSKMFWVEAMMIETYVINISPSAPLHGDIRMDWQRRFVPASRGVRLSEEKIIADWESTDRDWLDELRIHPLGLASRRP